MDIRKPNLSSAAFILKRHLAKQGVTLTHADALEIASAMEGFQSYHAYQTHQAALAKREAPCLEQENPDDVGCDYRYVGARKGGVWVRMRNISVRIRDCYDGVSVDLFNSGMEDQDPEAGTWHSYGEATFAQLEQAKELHDARDRIQAYCKQVGVEVFEDRDQPGMWCWTYAGEGCPMSLPSEWEAWKAAYEQLF